MAGVVKDGILQVNTSGGGGTPVSITDPLGSQPAASSVSVAIASDQIPLPISGTVAVTGSVAVTGPLTDAELRATPVPVSISSGIANPLPISAASLPLPTGASTSAIQTDGTQKSQLWDQNNSLAAAVVTGPSVTNGLATWSNLGIMYSSGPTGGGTDNITSGAYTRRWSGIKGTRLILIIDGTYANITLTFQRIGPSGNSFNAIGRRLDTGEVAASFGPYTNITAAFEFEGLGTSTSDFVINSTTYTSGTLSYQLLYDAGVVDIVVGGGSAVSIADGADVAEGAIADAAVITDTSGTLSGKLRGLVKWAFERMPISLGQKLMSASFPIVVASDQSAIPITLPAKVSVGTTFTFGGQTLDLALNSNTGTISVTAITTDLLGWSITFSISQDGVNFFPASFGWDEQQNVATSDISELSNSTSIRFAVAGWSFFRATVDSAGSAALDIVMQTAVASDSLVHAIIPAGLAVSLTDGINTPASIKAGGVLPVPAVDKALVVTTRDSISISSLPAGSNIIGQATALALVSDSRESYESESFQPLSLTTDGRLRVATSPSDNIVDFFVPVSYAQETNLWDAPSAW